MFAAIQAMIRQAETHPIYCTHIHTHVQISADSLSAGDSIRHEGRVEASSVPPLAICPSFSLSPLPLPLALNAKQGAYKRGTFVNCARVPGGFVSLDESLVACGGDSLFLPARQLSIQRFFPLGNAEPPAALSLLFSRTARWKFDCLIW